MRLLFFCLWAAVFVGSDALATEASETAFRYAIMSHIHDHPPPYPADLKDRNARGRATVTFAIDRHGGLADAKVTIGSGSTKADQEILDWLKRLQPFPGIPDDLSEPEKFSEEIVFAPASVLSDVKINWTADAISSNEAGFRDLVASHLRTHPRAFSDEMNSRPRARRSVVTLWIEQNGQLSKVAISKGSGSAKVDQETSDWLVAAQPYPQIPADLKAPLKLTAEIEFGPPGTRAGIWNDEKIKRAINNVCKGC
jgi:TonB family protein